MLSFEPSNRTTARHRKAELHISYRDFEPEEPSAVSRRKSTKLLISILVTFLIIVTQIFICHYYLAYFGKDGKIQNSKNWKCIYPGLGKIYLLAQEYEVDLVVIDPDVLDSMKGESTTLSLQFSTSAKRVQETRHKSIIHLAAINETSGGQPNLVLFHDALRHNGYKLLKYDDKSRRMQPEVYQDDSHRTLNLRETNFNKVTHLSYNHKLEEVLDTELKKIGPEKVSKVFTEFISHLFILNDTQSSETARGLAEKGCEESSTSPAKPFIVIHIVVLYNYEYDPQSRWIQPRLVIDERDKHELLRYNVHSFDFAIPVEKYYLHQKRSIISVVNVNKKDNLRNFDKFLILEPAGQGLTYENNSYTHCQESRFNINGLIENPKRYSNYLKIIDLALPPSSLKNHEFFLEQVATALQFIETFSKAYSNFNFWITGSTLLAYFKFCELALLPARQVFKLREGLMDSNDVLINLELGFFSDELKAHMIKDLAKAENIGITMITDWQKPDAMISFKLDECPNVIFTMYPYKVKVDLSQTYFVTKIEMNQNHRSNKHSQLIVGDDGYHIFREKNMQLCWTRLDKIHPFRVPCDIHDHLRRIFIV